MAHAGQLRCGTLRPQARLLKTAARGIAMRPFTSMPPAVRPCISSLAGARWQARHCPVETHARLRIPLEDLGSDESGEDDDEEGEDEEEEEEDLEGPLRLERGFENKIVQVRRVTKVVKGGKQLKFRVVVSGAQGHPAVGAGQRWGSLGGTSTRRGGVVRGEVCACACRPSRHCMPTGRWVVAGPGSQGDSRIRPAAPCPCRLCWGTAPARWAPPAPRPARSRRP